MTQISDAMKLNLDMANKRNIKATQVQDPDDKILAEKVNRESTFESNLY